MQKKFLSVLLALMLVISTLTVDAFAETSGAGEDTKDSSLQSVSLAVANSVLQLGDTTSVTASGALANGAAVKDSGLKVTYASSNSGVATVDPTNGTVIAKANGVVTITVEARLTKDSDGVAPKTAAAYVVCGTGIGDGTDSWLVTSPTRNKVKMLFFLPADGSLHYVVYSGDNIVVGVSPAGIDTSKGDFSSGLVFTSLSTRSISESYSMISGKKSTYDNHATETTFHFTKGGVPFAVVARAYDDGFAFRYVIDGAQAMTISSESTGYQVPTGSACVHMPYKNTYEGLYAMDDIQNVSGAQSVPFLYTTKDGTSVLLMEAELTTDYAGTMLQPGANGMLNLSFTAEQTGPATCASETFTSPWRCAVIGTLNDVIQTQLFENLSSPSTISDTSWITPGVSDWTWLNGEGCSSGDIYMKYIDLAAEMGWKYVLMDEGWQPNPTGGNRTYSGYYAWFKQVCQHAVEKGVGLIVWTSNALVNSTDPSSSAYVGKIEDWVNASKVTEPDGTVVAAIKGIKADFFNSEAQDALQAYQIITDECVKLHLVVNFHGANKPTGQRRTTPNVIAREGIYGNEHSPIYAAQNCLLPFTRAAAGPADYTPLLYDAGSDQISTNQLSALAVLIECGIPCFADTAENYRASQLYSWYKDMPAAWDDTRLLGADLGNYVAEARKSRAADLAKGAAEWYASAICTDARDADFNLSFLTPGKTYYATIYQDGDTNNDAVVSCRQVRSTDTLTVPMNQNGGCNIKFTTGKPSDSKTISLDKTSQSLEVGKTVTLTATLSAEKAALDYNAVNWTSSDTSVATVSSTGKVTAAGVGSAVITAATGLSNTVRASCKVTVLPPSYAITDRWTVTNPNPAHSYLSSEKSLTLLTESGGGRTASSDANITTVNASGDFTIESQLNYTPLTKSLPAGLIVYDQNGTYTSNTGRGRASKPFIQLLRGTTTTTTNQNANDANGINVTTQITATQNTITLKSNAASIVVPDQYADSPTIYLKIQRAGGVYTGYYSKDGVTWLPVSTDAASSLTFSNINDSTGVGVETANGTGYYENAAATFTDFSLNGAVIPFAEALGVTPGSGSDTGSGSGGSSSGSGNGSAPSVLPNSPAAAATYVSDTTADFGVNGQYQLKITSTDGKEPVVVAGTAGVFNVRLVRTVGNDYYIMLTAIGAVGARAGIYVNGEKLLVATVASVVTAVRCDTTRPFSIKKGAAYLFRLTADSKPIFTVGASSVMKVEFVKAVGKDYFYKVTAIGKAGDSVGIYTALPGGAPVRQCVVSIAQ